MLTFFERSPLDQVLKNDNVHKIQPSFQSPVKISGESHRATRNLPSPLSTCWTHLPHLGIQKDSPTEGWKQQGRDRFPIFMKQCVSTY